MSTDVEPNDWRTLDAWWSAHTQSGLVARNSSSAHALDVAGLVDYWEGLDSWWQAYRNSSPYASGAESTRLLDSDLFTDWWGGLNPWWETYAETGHETAVEIAALLDCSNEEWEQSAAPFDTDPLASTINRQRGPSLPSNEEGWSDWLARLLRPSSALVAELLSIAVEQPPENVIREDQLSKEKGTFRRPDILALYSDRGISIEVKLDDTHYAKTAETAGLIERDYPSKEWTHTLLLPKQNVGRLRANVEPSVSPQPEEGLQIEWETPGPVSVIYWRDVTMALRKLLLRNEIVNDHWAANAYLFCAAVEQQLLNFQPQSIMERLAQPASVVETMQPIMLADVLEEQLTYLRTRQNS